MTEREQALALTPLEGFLLTAGSSLQGLSDSEAGARRQRFGPNALPRVAPPPLLRKLAAQFTHLMALLLWGAAGLAWAAAMPQLAVAIVGVNVLNGLFSFWQEYRAQQATEALKSLLPRWARVRREGRELRLPAEDVVPGDLLLLSEGDQICADARVLWCVELRVDQSILTGESRAVARTWEPSGRPEQAFLEQPNLMFAGTSVAAGSARALVFATGGDTEFGRVAHLTQALPETPSPLELELARLTRTVTRLVLAIGFAFYCLATLVAGLDRLQSFLFALGMIVAFVPEGLLPTVTLSLALGVQRMAARRALVKKLSAVETLGCTNVICTDKTGTLTQNQMTVRELYCAGQLIRVEGVGYQPEGGFLVGGLPLEQPLQMLRELLTAASLCNDARLVHTEGGWSVLGDPTEGALQTLAAKAGLDPDALAREFPRDREIPFDSGRKRMTTVHGSTAFVKGAPREVLALCPGLAEPEVILEAHDEMARAGLRVLAVARRDLPGPEPRELESELTFLGLIGMHDPPRPEVEEAVRKCRSAGVRVLMLTGDYGLTAESIARRIGIVTGPSVRLVTGAELEGMAAADLQALLQSDVPLIFSRLAPEQKLRIVQALQALGMVVTVTGDGVNDAPALRQADIGVAMGRSGSDVAREAAAMVLSDDSFASIVAALEEGRAVYANLRRFVSYIFTSNVPEAVPFILFALTRGRIPLALTIMQILAIDLGTDMFPALALGAEPPEPGVMERPPRDRREPLITRALLGRALFLGILESAATLTCFWWGQRYGYVAATTMAFAAVVSCQVGNVLAHRTDVRSLGSVGLASNPWIGAAIGAELLFLGTLVYTPWLRPVFGTAPFPLEGWLLVLAWSPVILIADEIRKAWRRR